MSRVVWGFRLPSTSYLFINLTLQVIKPNLSEIGNSFCAKAQQYFWTKSGRVDFCLAKSIGGRGSVMWFSLCIEIVLYGLVVKFWKKTWDNWQSNGISPPLCRHGSYVHSRNLPAKMSIQCVLIPIKHLWRGYASKEGSNS